MKKSAQFFFLHSVLVFFLIPASSFSEKYKICDVEYELQETKQSAAEKNIPISTERTFESKEEFEKYIEDLRTRFQNQRVFQETSVTYECENDTDGEICKVHLKVAATDSKSLLILPYPKYSSSDGLSVKMKIKDANFLGRMSELSADAYFAIETDEDDETVSHKAIGFNFEYNFPFQAGPFDITWNNDFFAEYTLDTKKCEFDTKTGLTFSLPRGTYSLVFDISQSFVRNLEYAPYDDEFYMNSDASLSMPITVADIDGWGKIKWIPYADFSANYKTDGSVNENNIDITSPLLTFAHKAETKRIDWIGNFRNGFSAETGQSISYNFQRNEYYPRIYTEIKAHKAFCKYFSASARLYAFASFSRYEKIGERLRGIIDEQKYKDSAEHALKVTSAITMNIDAPIRLLATDWNTWTEKIFGEESWITRHTAWFRYFDFEMQVSPFIDIALTKNAVTGSTFALEDGWYSGGIEVLIFPKKWKSVVVRGSVGVDLARTVLNRVSDTFINESFRNSVSSKEIYIGLGLLY